MNHREEDKSSEGPEYEEERAESQPFEFPEEDRERSRPFDYPEEERHAGIRAVRHISREAADADMPPGTSGSYGTTGGGQPGGTGVGSPAGAPVPEEELADTTLGSEPRPDDTEAEEPGGGSR
ncbi:hypothetical protein [Allostreptomyces psammosilenae]|uniref:Uncharacterized protein n=1 Tax=Allostreptomyces psammosilenae TaxID=1892865 RepID=A0A853A8L1_9ACTN|nr:hypothetical protein [Allostreptomyces psammosilenae]NYI06868.1 hypothetical protein [Allostreptomyces psammosilenae]